MQGVALTQQWLETVAPTSELVRLDPQTFRDHERFVQLMQEVETHGGGVNASLLSMLPRAFTAPEYRLSDYRRWLQGANRGSGPMWEEYLARDLIAEVPVMPVPILLVSGALDMNTPVPLVRQWFAAVEAPRGKRMELFSASGHAPFLTETARFVETVRAFGSELAGRRAQ